MADGRTTSPRMHHAESCKCFSPLKRELKCGRERVQKSGPTHQAEESVPGTNWVQCQRNFDFVYTVGNIQMRSNFMKPLFCLKIILKYYFWCWMNWFLCLNALLPALSGCDALPYTPPSGPASSDTKTHWDIQETSVYRFRYGLGEFQPGINLLL